MERNEIIRQEWNGPLTLREIGEKVGLSYERVRQLGVSLKLGYREPKKGGPRGPRKYEDRPCLQCGKVITPSDSRSRTRKYCSRACFTLSLRGRGKYKTPEYILAMPRRTPEERKARSAAYTNWHYHNVIKKDPKRIEAVRARNRTDQQREYVRRWREGKLKEDPDYFNRKLRERIARETPEQRERRLARYREYSRRRYARRKQQALSS